ncbi:hypothetical protein RN001_002148 [Aquatica leii]|uniref:Uncharacterized protein n=1 Tax=Aquatica leii TaxID=1421715 RepID=A0AAN7Q8F0_9COLE|nr:hypothetical protein RN001_002148 [Aquatica leii]
MNWSMETNLLPDDIAEIQALVPSSTTYKYNILKFNSNNKYLQLQIIGFDTKEKFEQWRQEFQEFSKTTFSIYSSHIRKGKPVLFTQELHCHHNTRTSTSIEKKSKKY